METIGQSKEINKNYHGNYLCDYTIHWTVKVVFASEIESLWLKAWQVYSPSSLCSTGSSNNVEFSCLEASTGSLWSIIRFPFGIRSLFPLYHLICNEWMASATLMAIQIKLTLSPSTDTVWLLMKVIMGGPIHYIIKFCWSYILHNTHHKPEHLHWQILHYHHHW